MTIPYREWNKFQISSIEGNDPDDDNFTVVGDWTGANYDYLLFGHMRDPWWRWDGLVRPSAESFKSQTSLDSILDALLDADVGLVTGAVIWTSIYIWIATITEGSAWVEGAVTGKHYDGVNEWASFPAAVKAADHQDSLYIAEGTFPTTISSWLWSYKDGTGKWANAQQANLFRNGFKIYTSFWPPQAGSIVAKFSGRPLRMKIRYFNAVVNSLSRASSPLAGGVPLVLTGLGFDNDEDELNENAHNPVLWDDTVDFIYFDGLQGQGTTTLTRTLGDFTVDSNTQITIAAMPAMAAGTYNIRLRKQTIGAGIGDVYSYAGDFFCDGGGRIRDGMRMEFVASDTYPPDDPPPDDPIILTKWRFKNRAEEITVKNWAEIDTRANDTFYDGRITGLSSLRRGINITEGLYNVSDMTFYVSNADKEISQLLATNFLKNQLVDIFLLWGNRTHADRTAIARCIVEDYNLQGPEFKIIVKDITRKYFDARIPKYLCTADEYANIHDAANGRSMPEILGLCSVTTGENLGATEAVYVDTTTFEYLAARGSLNSVDEVYSDGVEMTGGGVDYDIFYKDGGRTYIDFVNDQGDNKITFNSKGYMFPDWDSANGYVQNPAYILAFALAFIAEIPIELMDIDSFETLAGLFEDAGYDETGHLNIQDQTDFDSVLRGLLNTYGCKGFPDLAGRFKAEKKTLSSYTSAALRLFDQIHLMRPANRDEGLKDALNLAKAVFNYHPNPDVHLGSWSATRPSSITDFEAEIDGGGEIELPWTSSAALVKERVQDILYRRGYGEKILRITVSIKLINELDIFTDFRFQDPFGLSATGAGETGRYYYVSALNYNWKEGTIDIEAIDLQWLLRQYFILGDEDTLDAAWATAPELDRMFGYLCDEVTGKFSDGEDGKILITEVGL